MKVDTIHNTNSVVKNTGFLYAKMGITMFISLYTTRLILNALGVSDFGVFNIVGGAIAMLGFMNAAMASATQRFMSYTEGEGDKEKQKSIFNISFVLHIAIALILVVALLIAGYFFFNGILNIPPDRIFAAKVVYASLIISTMFTVMTVPYDAVLNAHENMLYYSIVGIIESLLKLTVALLVVWFVGDKLIIYGILMAIIPLITMTIMRIYCHRKYTECVIAPRQYWNKNLMKEMTSFAGWNLLSTSINMTSAYGQGVVLNVFFGTVLNAAQGIAGQINGQLQVLSSNMLKALNPAIGKSAGANNIIYLKKATFIGAKYSTSLFLLIALPVFFQTPYILELWLNKVPDWTIVFIRFQLVKTFIEFQFGTIPTAIYAIGKIKKITFWASFFNLLQLPLIYLFFDYGFEPYFMYIVSIIFGNIIVYFIALHYASIYCNISISEYIKNVSIPVYSILFSMIAILFTFSKFIKVDSFISFFYFLSISILIFPFVFYILGNTKAERIQLINLLKKNFNRFKSK